MGSLATPSTDGAMNFGQEHLTHRAFSRRQFLGGAVRATAIGAAAGSGFLSTPIALADDETDSSVMPRPIPGGFLTPFGVISHHFRPARGIEASTITDFNGFVGLAEIDGGRGVGTNTLTGVETPMFFGMDNRFMIGEFVGVDGEVHRGAFGFI